MYNTTDYAGIDYGLGQSNVDPENGIRFGVIPQNEILQAWADSSEADYPPPACPHCGDEYGEDSEGDCKFTCESCGEVSKDYEVNDMVEPLGFYYHQDGYRMYQSGDDHNVFVTKSPYYTNAQFCSPCAPGAGYLPNPCPNGPKTYCVGADWFEDGKAPYPVYLVETGELVS